MWSWIIFISIFSSQDYIEIVVEKQTANFYIIFFYLKQIYPITPHSG